MLHMRTRPGGPSTALGWDAGAFPWIFPSLFPPAPTTPAHCGHLHPAPPPSPRPGTGPGWLCPIPWGLVASPSSERLKSPHLAGHVASRWQPRPFPQPWGCSYSSAPSSIEPNPPPATSRAPAPLKPLLPSRSTQLCNSHCLHSPTGTRNLPILGSLSPCQPPATLLHATAAKSDLRPSVCPPASQGCSPQALPLQPQPQDRARCLGLFWAAATKISPGRPSPLSWHPSCPLSPLCPLCPKLCPPAAWSCIAQCASPCTSRLPSRFQRDASEPARAAAGSS